MRARRSRIGRFRSSSNLVYWLADQLISEFYYQPRATVDALRENSGCKVPYYPGRMPARTLTFVTHIRGAAEAIFDLVADMPNYGRWLPDSPAFGGTVDVTPYPVRLGTTYVDAGPIQKPGSVTEYDRPVHISFHHTVQIRQNFLNTDIDARIRYTFDPRDGGTSVERTLLLTFDLHGISRLALPFILYGFRKENDRTLAALKRYIERRAP